MERKRRSFAKAISWRIIAFLVTAILTFTVTGSAELALGVGLGDSLIKLVIYYFHERAWAASSFGIEPVSDSVRDSASNPTTDSRSSDDHPSAAFVAQSQTTTGPQRLQTTL